MPKTTFRLPSPLLWLLLVLFAAPALAQTPMIGAEYTFEGDATIEVGWDAVQNAVAYEVRLTTLHVIPVTHFALARVPAPATTVQFTQPRAGHFVAEARACRFADCRIEDTANPENDVTRWAISYSDQDAIVGATPMGWWIYWKLKGFTGPVIE